MAVSFVLCFWDGPRSFVNSVYNTVWHSIYSRHLYIIIVFLFEWQRFVYWHQTKVNASFCSPVIVYTGFPCTSVRFKTISYMTCQVITFSMIDRYSSRIHFCVHLFYLFPYVLYNRGKGKLYFVILNTTVILDSLRLLFLWLLPNQPCFPVFIPFLYYGNKGPHIQDLSWNLFWYVLLASAVFLTVKE